MSAKDIVGEVPRLVRLLGGRTEQASAYATARVVPRTFEPTLMPRSYLDQGLATGIAMAMTHAWISLVHDSIESVGMLITKSEGQESENRELRQSTIALDLAAMFVGFGLQTLFRQHPGEKLSRGAMRTLGFSFSLAGYSGATAAALQELLSAVDEETKTDHDLRSLPIAIPAGALVSSIGEWRRRRRYQSEDAPLHAGEEWHVSALKSLTAGVATTAGISTLTWGQREFAGVVGKALARVLPGGARLWRPAGHILALGALGFALYGSLERVFHRIEERATKLEPGFEDPPTSEFVSGGSQSKVSYESLSKQGRRNVSTFIRPEWIERVMDEPARAHPIRVFVGLDSASSDEERVALAMEELERTGAFDRSLLLLVSPTGTGYVNYVAVESVEYLTRGDVASCTIQYSKRPSPLSMNRVDEGRHQDRMLLHAVHERLKGRSPEKRPRLVLFGESLGAFTSQDEFLHHGTDGLVELRVDGAVWIGTPYMSKWKSEVLNDQRPDVDHGLIGKFDHFGELEALDEDARRKLRYVMISHYNDAVTYFGLDLLLACPDWLGPPETRPPGVPKSERYGPVATFVLTLVDMKNAAKVIPGKFEAKGHDYRADLLRFIREVYRLKATDEQMTRIEEAMRRYELERAEWISDHKQKQQHERNHRH